MARHKAQDTELRVKGLSLWAKFTLSMTVALAIVMAIAGYSLYSTSLNLAHGLQEKTLIEATKLSLRGMRKGTDFVQDGNQATAFENGRVQRFQIRYKAQGASTQGVSAYLYQASDDDKVANVVVPQQIGQNLRRGLLGLIIAISSAVVFIGALVSFFIANQVSKPLETLIDDIRQIAHGNLRHKTRVRAGGEVALLARTVDRMTASLAEAQEAELELSIREREGEVANEVREALLSDVTPQLAGYDVASLHMSSVEPGGDFHDFIEFSDGRLGLIACDVSGSGIPGALVGATARAYLKIALTDADDVEEALKKINRELARDLKRGMFVTLLFALIDPSQHTASVLCAGHKIALVRYTAVDGKVRLVHPEGIALGFDKGPVFDRSIQAAEIPMAPGDRLFLSNTGPVRVSNEDGEELGEKNFFRSVMKHSAADSETALDQVAADLESFAGEEPFPADITFVTIKREA
jgi:sigma-B regulation protein RsbU (phosphoserine phosphatase)